MGRGLLGQVWHAGLVHYDSSRYKKLTEVLDLHTYIGYRSSNIQEQVSVSNQPSLGPYCLSIHAQLRFHHCPISGSSNPSDLASCTWPYNRRICSHFYTLYNCFFQSVGEQASRTRGSWGNGTFPRAFGFTFLSYDLQLGGLDRVERILEKLRT